MSYAQNKSLAEYGDLSSMHHSDRHAEEQAGIEAARLEDQPATLNARLLIGGSYIIEWSKGDAEVPVECQGLWTGVTQAKNAINTCMARLKQEARDRETAELDSIFAESEEAAKVEEEVEAKAPLNAEKEPPVRKKATRKKSA